MLPPHYVADFRRRTLAVMQDRHIIPDVGVVTRPGPKPAGKPKASRAADPAIVIVERPVESLERFIEILYIPDRRLVGVIELASQPTSGTRGDARRTGRNSSPFFSSDAHLIEIDLLRGGPHWAAVSEQALQKLPRYDYLICVSRSGARDRFECYLRTLRERLPSIAIPLLPADGDVVLDIQDAFDGAYDQGHHRDWLRYDKELRPPLRAEDREWVERLLREHGLPAGGGSA